MLQLARAALGEAQLSRASVRQGDLHRPPFEAGSFDVAVMHHVLHLLDDPAGAIVDAARLLRPGGRLLVADFAGHELEQLRRLHGHRRLGIADARDARLGAGRRARGRERAHAAADGRGRAADRPPVAAARRLARRTPSRGVGLMSAVFSFEVFPPRTPEAELRLWDTLERLAPLEPSFVSVTCGAGGSATDATLGVLRAVAERTALPIAGHLTCVGTLARGNRRARSCTTGTPACATSSRCAATRPGTRGASSLTPTAIRTRSSWSPRSAGTDRSRSASPPTPSRTRIRVSMVHDLAVLARKADAGATRAITQFCFDTDPIVSLRERIASAGIALTVVPGILLATDFAAVARMATRCGASVPSWLGERFAGLDDDPQTRKLVGAIVAAEQVDRLRREGFEDFHFYTLNQGDLAPAVCRLLGVRQAPEQADAA